MAIETLKDKIARDDHDTLIRVETTVNNMAVDLKTLADGLATRVTAVETRVTSLEKINDEVKPPALSTIVTEHDRQIREFQTTVKNLRTLISWLVGGSLITFITTVLFFTKFFGLFK